MERKDFRPGASPAGKARWLRRCAAPIVCLAGIGGLPFGGDAGATDLIGHGGAVRALDVSGDLPADGRDEIAGRGVVLLTGSFDTTVRLWNLSGRRETARLLAHTQPVNAVAFLPRGRGAVSGGDDGAVVLWDIAAGRAAGILGRHDGKVAALAASPSGDRLASVGWDRTIRLFDIAGGREAARFDHTADLTAVAFLTETILLTGDKDGVITGWDLAKRQPSFRMPAHEQAVTALAVERTAPRLLSAGADGVVRWWDPLSRTEIAAMRGHRGPVLAVALAPDGGSALSGGLDGQVLQWSLPEGHKLRRIAAHGGPVWSVALTPDGRLALSAGSGETVRVADLATAGEQAGAGPALLADARPSLVADARPWLDSDLRGAKLYRACAPCHALQAGGIQRSGPHFAGLLGRRAGAVSGYDYSPRLRDAGLTWNEATLRALLSEGPDAFLPGTKMPLQRIPQAEDRDALIDYLRVLTAGPAAASPPAPETRKGP